MKVYGPSGGGWLYVQPRTFRLNVLFDALDAGDDIYREHYDLAEELRLTWSVQLDEDGERHVRSRDLAALIRAEPALARWIQIGSQACHVRVGRGQPAEVSDADVHAARSAVLEYLGAHSRWRFNWGRYRGLMVLALAIVATLATAPVALASGASPTVALFSTVIAATFTGITTWLAPQLRRLGPSSPHRVIID